MGLAKFWKNLTLAQNAEKVYVSDTRPDVMGVRMIFDLEEFVRLRRAMRVPDELVYHVSLTGVDPENEINGGFTPASHDFVAWEISLPVSDRFSFNRNDLDQINRNLAMLLRHTVQAYDLLRLFDDMEVMRTAFENIQELLSEDAKFRAGLAKGFRVVVPSVLPPEIELERGEDHGTRDREGQTHPED